jgi:poly [ADP-ribose] polymerase
LAGEEVLLQWIRDAEPAPESPPAADAFWIEISNKWFTLFPTTRPYTMRGFEQIADNVQVITSFLILSIPSGRK